MSNSIATIDNALPFLAEVEAALPVLQNGNTQFNRGFIAGAGDSIRVLLPGYGNDAYQGADLTSQLSDVRAEPVTVTLLQYSKGCALTLLEDALKIQNRKDQIDVPYGQKFASDIQIKAVEELLLGAGNVDVITTLQVNPSATADKTGYLDISKGIAKLHTARASGKKYGVMSPIFATIVINSGLQFFQASKQESNTNGLLGTFRGVEFSETQDIGGLLTIGAQTLTTVLVDQPTAYVAGATLINLDGASTIGTLVKGQVFTVAGTYSVDLYGASTGVLYPFVVQADIAAASGTTITSVPIRGVYATGALKNVTALPANNAAVVFPHTAAKSYHQVLIWDKQAFVVASAKLAENNNAKETVSVNGKIMNLTMSTGGDFLKNQNYIRWDCLIGFKVLYRNMVSRVDVIST